MNVHGDTGSSRWFVIKDKHKPHHKIMKSFATKFTLVLDVYNYYDQNKFYRIIRGFCS